LGPQLDQLDDSMKMYEAAAALKRASLEDLAIAVPQINTLIAEFLGAGELELVIPSQDHPNQYRVMRRGAQSRYLSEGEKSVVALAYFLVKIEEEGNDLSSTIVVLDDPVDSQDSLFLFRTYGLLRRRLEHVGQLFVLTHNHEFFNLMRDWLASKAYRDESNLLWIEMSRENGNRKMDIKESPPLLRAHKSEYHYLYYRLYAYHKHIEPLDAPLVPNVARKVLEYFASFKWACKSSEQLAQ